MSRSVVICEGSTDFALLQYYLRRAHMWEDVKDKSFQNQTVRNRGQKSRLLAKGASELTVMAAGGASRIPEALSNVLTRMESTPPDGSMAFDNIVIITDRDENDTEQSMLDMIDQAIKKHVGSAAARPACRRWSSYAIKTKTGLVISFKIHVLIIPFERNGAMETFLLDAVTKNDPYDGDIVQHSENFVNVADPEKRYLTKRSYSTKAVFDAFFSIRTAVRQFNERQNVFLSVNWEDYATVNKGFKVFAEL